MNPAYIPIIIMWIMIVITSRQNRNNSLIAAKIRRKGANTKMLELAKAFIGKECLIYTFNGSQVQGVVKEISGSAMLVENNGTSEVINLDYVVRLREYPRDKKGKKKSVVLD